MEPAHVPGNTLDLILSSRPDDIHELRVISPGLSDYFKFFFLADSSLDSVLGPVIVKK